MNAQLTFSLLALAALVPAALLPMGLLPERGAGRDGLFWVLLLLAAVGPLAWATAQTVGSWQAGFSQAIWITVATCMVIFIGMAATWRTAKRLAPLLLPYLFILGLLATLGQIGQQPEALSVPSGAWLRVHILSSVVTYAVLTLAAIAGMAVVLQERALKAKRPTPLTRALPSVADGERLQLRLLASAAGALLLGLISGMAAVYMAEGSLLRLDHKTVFTLLSLAVIALSLTAYLRWGVRGRRASRYVLLAYLLLTLGYLGVKFVTDILVA